MIIEDTICAISTAHGIGGIAVIRVSGKDAIAITDKIFKSIKQGKTLSKAGNQSLNYGEIIENENKTIDNVLVSVFHGPHSFTGEDTTEISCHGSIFIQQKIIELLINAGARMAKAGEYTKRAFLNGKMDLSQAEAVADLIASTSAASHRIALNQMRGGFSNELKNLRAQLLKFVSLIELELDFSTEDVEFANREQLNELVHSIQSKILKLTQSFKEGNAIKNGIPVAIIGKTNVGKSTLLNNLLNEEKAIVSDINGTTRDAIEDLFTYQGIQFRLIDTAGLRKTNDAIEKIGIERSYKKMEESAIVLLMVDGTDSLTGIEQFITENLKLTDNKETLLLINKEDLINDSKREDILSLTQKQIAKNKVLFISAKNNLNRNILLDKLIECSHINSSEEDNVIVSNLRHYEALKQALEAINAVENGLSLNYSGDLLSRDIRDCIDALGEITGEISNDEVLGNIFSHFCIGK